MSLRRFRIRAWALDFNSCVMRFWTLLRSRSSLARGLLSSIRRGMPHRRFAAASAFPICRARRAWFCDLYNLRVVCRGMSASLTSHPSIGKGEERSTFSRGRHARNRVVFIDSRRGCGAEGEMLGIRTSLTWPYVRVQPAVSPAKIERRPSGASC